ncbi:MAG TPA: ABC transporter substrate-binding protein [Thermomicrobiales bacterium]|nr:ABC transporter substrate-binding protein [Thermomicrobiales bacterium]
MSDQSRPRYSHAYACSGDSCQVSRRTLLKSAALLTGGIALAGLPDQAFAQDSSGMIPRLNGGGMGGGTNPQANFNVYSPNKISGTEGLLFEKLYFINGYNCEENAWLAESYEWKDPQTLIFTIRDGVTWNDGTAFSAEDVAFTFDLLKKFPALDTKGSTNGLDTITADGATVTFAFTEPSTPSFFTIVDTFIVPKHVWEGEADPVTFVNADNPVGTGPYTLGSFNSEAVVWTLRDDYWNGESIKVQEIGYSKPAEGQANMLRLANGEYDWDAQFIPNVDKVYVAKDPDHNKYWFAQGACISLYFNLTKDPFKDVAFRKAVASAVDRDEIAQKAQLGYVTTASQTGLKLPGQKDWLNPDIPNEGNIAFDQDAAKKTLTDAGYTYDGDKLLTPAGQPVEFSFKIPAGWSDWIQAGNIIKSNLEDIGMKVNVETPDPTIVNDQDRKNGSYDLVFGVHGGSCSMYRNFYDHMASAASAPVGEPADSNFVRWEDKKTDDLLTQFLSAQTEDEQKEIAFQLEQIMWDSLPTIPLWYGAIWFEYRTENAEGWPNQDDPYAASGDLPLILQKLVPPA